MKAADERDQGEESDRLVPVRMINEWLYCPRLAYLEWVEGEWADNQYTVDGRRIHGRVDRPDTGLPEPDEVPAEGRVVGRSVGLSHPLIGLTGKLDLVEATDDGAVRPVDYKRSAKPDVEEGAWLPERGQVAAQAMLLRAHGYRVDEGVLYFAGSKQRVTVALTDDLLEQVREATRALREAAESRRRPPPLVDSPKCVGCSLAPLCLPDETTWLTGALSHDAPKAAPPVRPLSPGRPDGVPVHVTVQGAQVGVRGEELDIRRKGETLQRVGLAEVSTLSVYGAVNITTPAIGKLLREGIPIAYHTRGGYLVGLTTPTKRPGLDARLAQYRAATDETWRRRVAASMVRDKIANQRTLVRRNHGGDAKDVLDRLAHLARKATDTTLVDTVRGYEGDAAARYFECFGDLLRPPADADTFRWTKRTRRPPADPVNAVLSFCYALLAGEWTATLHKVGLDPMLGYLHRPRPGRPALALDLMEPFRPIVADSVMLTLVNTGQLDAADFVRAGDACGLSPKGRRTVLKAWEARLDTLVTHPLFGYRASYRRIFEVQARLFARWLTGELEHWPAFRVR
ncbi:MAG: CRISPR-associated endonuclease Cas1 [Myxococcales bacterium]|nr:CRISPR-associated endonuclease Cas1 [Myxococcales bacterium]